MTNVRSSLPVALFLLMLLASLPASAQPADPAPDEQEPVPAAPPAPPPDPVAPEPPAPPTSPPVPEVAPSPQPEMSEGRMLVSLYNAGFQWGVSPGVVFSDGKAGFTMGLNFGYGFDTGPVILVPGVRLVGYFTERNAYIGMPIFRVVLPIDRFAPFIQGGVGVGHLEGELDIVSKTSAALMGGGGLMVHFRPVAFGVEASYQTITGTSFKGFGIGPILAIGF